MNTLIPFLFIYIYEINLISNFFWSAFIFFFKTLKPALCQKTALSKTRVHNFKQLK